MKKTGHVMIGFGIFFILLFLLTNFNILALIAGVALIYLGYSRNKKYKASIASAPPAKRPHKVETMYVHGLNYRLDSLLEMAGENDDYEMTKKQIIDAGKEDEKIYQYEFADYNVKLEKEPDNQADPNAIKVILNGNFIGYVPAKKAVHVGKLMDAGAIMKLQLDVTGGKYKIVTDDELQTDEEDYQAELIFTLDSELSEGL